ncbi:MAG: PEP/pyruvate-binding domain-containing protein, partial [Candidatus Margulisbacteria bacterium]|nr:PEP/pyruvate-binding domain-containing protein [Candidatus Margulisiibacteriota bacterium]
GKYESIFCVNQGSPEERYANFERTVRQVFASTMNEDALTYRRQRGLGLQDEQMALLVQRVSGTHRKHYFFPYLAGVGVSYNTFVWHGDMDPKAGMLRLVFGLGTRAVNRVEGDYPRLVALDHPLLRPYGPEDVRKFSQHEVDLLNIAQNELQTVPLTALLAEEPDLKLDLVGKRDLEAEKKLKAIGTTGQSWVLTFDELLSKTEFPAIMRDLLKTLDSTYRYPVDVEFTVNYDQAGGIQINLLQCRPLQAKGPGGRIKIPAAIPPGKIFFRSPGNFMGGSVSLPLRRVIFVDPKNYSELLHSKKYSVARLIGRLNKLSDRVSRPVLLVGPGRWGTRDATLGVPVSFAEINNFSALVEISDPAIGFMPELSFGSHFFLDLVEAGIFYTALFPERPAVSFDRSWLLDQPNILDRLLPEEAALADVIRVCDVDLQILSDITSQAVVCLKQER